MEKQKYYITTAIPYTSQKPHIGNSYEIVLTDAVTRFKRMQGFDVFFLTGTDEHGQKIEDCAKKAGVSPKEWVDGITNDIKRVYDLLEIKYDGFIRTTDEIHEKAVQK
ncbi:MAG: class I tRNA ligase family protein, partial [Clostridia bacterium]|nr:class I tRNA ligase family protein [Clostridia bacterium]